MLLSYPPPGFSSMRKGYLALVLHAHLPFVRHPEYPDFLEEDWLFEAITETYLPLWQVFEGLIRDGVPFRLTMSFTPPLCAMLNDELFGSAISSIWIARSHSQNAKSIVLRPNRRSIISLGFIITVFSNAARSIVDRLQCDLVGAFKRFQATVVFEIITCAATHGFLPLMEQHPEAVRAQILIARDDYQSTLAGNRAASGSLNAPTSPDSKTICKRLNCAGFPSMPTV